jgi:hypothetical protein
MPSIGQKVKEGYAEGGVARLFEAFVNGLKKYFSRYIYFHKTGRLLEWSLTGPVPQVEPPQLGIEVRELKEEELPYFKDIIREEKIRLFRRRLAEGKVCLVAWHGREVAWFGWVCKGFEYEPIFGVMLDLKEDEGDVLDAFTNPKYRGRNLHTYMSTKRLERLQKMGVRRAYGIALVGNIPSRKAHKKGGCVETREVSYFNVLGIKFHRWKDIKK